VVFGSVLVTRIVVIGALALVCAAGTSAATGSVTIAARPSAVTGSETATLFGTVANGRTGESVTIEVKPCGQPSFTGVVSATTGEGGHWTAEYWPGANATVRARWEQAVSAPLALRQRAWVRLLPRPTAGRFYVSVAGRVSVWRKRVSIQRRAGGRWRAVKNVVLTNQDGTGTGGVVNGAGFALRVPRGSVLRAVFARSQAKPCYLAGVSTSVRA
jgi:hypothetical protein